MLLGYRFSPRLADLGETRFYRLNSSANYGPLNSIARHRINTDLIARNWDDLLRVAGSPRLPSRTTARRPFVQTVLEQGWADEATLAATYDAMRAWGEHPDAYQAVMMCEAIGWVDEGGPDGA